MTFKKSTLTVILFIMALVGFGILVLILLSMGGEDERSSMNTIEREAAQFAASAEVTGTTAAAVQTELTLTQTAAAVQDRSSYNDGYNAGYTAGLLDGEKQSAKSGNEQESYQKGYEAGLKDGRSSIGGEASETAEPVTVTVSGSFTATVRAVMPDHETDDKTPRAAVIQFDRGSMFIMKIAPEVCKLLSPDETYTFLVDEQTVTLPSAEDLSEDGTLSADILTKQYIAVGSVRAPRDSETGARGMRLTYKFAESDNKGEIS